MLKKKRKTRDIPFWTYLYEFMNFSHISGTGERICKNNEFKLGKIKALRV